MRNNNFSTKLLCPQTYMRNIQCKKHRISIFIQTFCWLVPGQKGKHHSPKVTLSEYLLMQFEYASAIHLTAKSECSLKIKTCDQEPGELLLPGEACDFLRHITTRLCSDISSVSTAEDSFLTPSHPSQEIYPYLSFFIDYILDLLPLTPYFTVIATCNNTCQSIFDQEITIIIIITPK